MATLAWRAPSYICKSGLFMAARMTAGSGALSNTCSPSPPWGPAGGSNPDPLWGEQRMVVGLQLVDETG